jgi:hypothetical protein
MTLSDEYGYSWVIQAGSDRNWSVADLDFKALYGKSDQYVTFSVTSGDVTSRVVTATYDVTDPTSDAKSPVNNGWYLQIAWEADDAFSGVALVELWCRGPATDKWDNTGYSGGGTSGSFHYYPTQGDGTYYFATRSVEKAGNWEEGPHGDGDTWIYYTAPAGPGTWPDGHSGLEGGGGGCFIATATSDYISPPLPNPNLIPNPPKLPISAQSKKWVIFFRSVHHPDAECAEGRHF